MRYEELQYLCEIAISLGINRFKITGGEPLVRKDALRFIAHVKQLEGAASVTLTTNGYYLKPYLPQLQALHIDGVNISLDTLDDDQYAKLTRIAGCQRVQDAIRACVAAGIHTKINAVLLAETKEQILPLAALCQKYPVDVRFIELMLIGYIPKNTATISTTVYQLWRTNDEYSAFIWVLINIVISAVVLLTVNMLEKRSRERKAWS